MLGWRWPAGAAVCGIVLLIAGPPGSSAAAPCDEYDPAAAARSVVIALSPTDFTDEQRDEMRSFIETGSLGRVDGSIVSSSPRGFVHSLFAVPEISRFSPYYGESLKGIALGVIVKPHRGPVRVVVRLRQVCARFFRNSFLYQ